MDKNTIMKNMGLSILLSTCAFETHGMEQPRPGLGGMVIRDQHSTWSAGETAMDTELGKQIVKCFTVIYNRIPILDEIAVTNAYNDVVNFINSPANANKLRRVPTNGVFMASRLMCINARRTLVDDGLGRGISQNYLYGRCPTEHGEKDVKMKEMLARVWIMIKNHTNPLESTLMKANLFENLNYCIEDNGNLTCDYGTTKRIVCSIEGFFEGINLTVVLPEPIDFCSQYDREFLENLANNHPDDPLNFASSYEVPENFSLADLEVRIVREREVVRLRINGLYGAGSPRANAAIELMEGYFNRWRQTYNDNAPIHSLNGAVSANVPVRISNNIINPNQERYNELLQRVQDLGEYFFENQEQVDELARLGLENERFLRAERERQTADSVAPLANAIRERLAAGNRAEAARMRVAAAQLNGQPAGRLGQASAWPHIPGWAQSLVQPAVQQLTPNQIRAAQKAQARQAKRDAAQVKKAQKVQARQAKRASAQMRKAQKIAAQQVKKAAAQMRKVQKAAQRLAARQRIAV